MAETSFDVLVIGAGPGGYVTAIRAAQLGFKTAIVERDQLGGICLNWGCIPTKALLRSAEIYHYMTHAKDYGLTASNVGFDAAAVVARSRAVAKQLSNGVAFLMKKNKVTVIEGSAKISKPGEITVEGKGAGKYQAKHVIVATGARPRVLARHRAGQEADLDLFRSHGSGKNAEVAARDRLGRDRHRVRELLPDARQRSDGRRSAAADPAGRGRGDRRLRAQALREAGDQDPHRRESERRAEEERFRRRHGRGRQGHEADDRSRAGHFRGRRRRQYRESRARGAGRED